MIETQLCMWNASRTPRQLFLFLRGPWSWHGGGKEASLHQKDASLADGDADA